MFSNLKIGENLTKNKLNRALKDLYYTDYFKNVEVDFDNQIVTITVNENPIIQKIIIKGIKKNKIKENVQEISSKIEKYPFVESKINEQVTLLHNILKSYGYYFVELETIINTNSNNTVDLIYNFNLGEIAKIKKINFIGDKIFRDNTLRNIIISEENKFWKFLTKNKFLDNSRINLDVNRLNNFYKNRGYFNVNIKSTTAIITNQNQFELIFNINAGEKYFFDNITIEKNTDFLNYDIKYFEDRFLKLKNKPYSIKKINKLVDELNEFTLNNDFVFINAKFNEIIKDKNKIDISVYFDSLEKQYVDRINILGNFITDEKVIRNNLIVDEGDAYNDILFNKSIQNIKSKNIFKSVNYKTENNINNNKLINIIVEEKATGEIFAGAGAGTAGTTLTAGIKENNYLGLGVKLDTNFSLTEDTLKGKFSVINPNFKNTDRSIQTTIESTSQDFMSSSGYKTNKTGFSVGTEFEQKNDLFVNLELSNYYEDLETSSTASNIIKKQEGNYFENLLTYRITYNKLDQNFQPSDGFKNNFSQTLPIISDDLSIEYSFTSSGYHSINDNLILSARFFLKTVNSLDVNVRVSKRVFGPGRRLRGFESGKIGPKDGGDFIGGNYITALNFSTTLPQILENSQNIDFLLFLDAANVWGVDYSSTIDDGSEIRSAIGFGVDWFTPIGPLNFSISEALTKSSTDITENFRFNLGTTF